MLRRIVTARRPTQIRIHSVHYVEEFGSSFDGDLAPGGHWRGTSLNRSPPSCSCLDVNYLALYSSMSDTLLTSMGINAVFHVHKEESRTPFRWLLMGFCHEERCDVETLAFNLFRVNNKTICYGIAIHRDGCGMSHPVFYQSYVAKKDVECCLNGCSIFSLLDLFQGGI